MINLTTYNLFIKLFGLTKIPLMLFANPRLTKMDDEMVEVMVPLNWRTKNHLRSMYFGALAVGADCAAGIYATYLIRESKHKVHLSFKDFTAQFLKRPTNDVYFICRENREIKRLLQQVIDQPGHRFNYQVKLEAYSKFASSPLQLKDTSAQSLELVATFTLTLSLKKTLKKP